MEDDLAPHNEFEAEVAGRFGILPNFFRSAQAAPELIQQLWGFAKAGYLDNPMPSVFKERLFAWLSRFCPMRYCIVRHVGFLLGQSHGRAAGDAAAVPQTIDEIVGLLRRPSPWQREMEEVYALLEGLTAPIDTWPGSGTELEDAIFACAAVMFVEPVRSERARRALVHAAFDASSFSAAAWPSSARRTTGRCCIRKSRPKMTCSTDARHEDLARLLLEDPEADRCEMGERLFAELTSLRELNERQELERAKQALEEKDRQKDHFIAVIAHELRNPLGAIRWATDASLMQMPDPRAAQLVERLDRQTTAMTRMLEDLQDASRTALGKVSVRLERVGLPELLADVLNEQQTRTEQAGLNVIAQFPGQVCFVKADRVRLRQILDNLLANAIKFTPADGTVELSLAQEAGHAVVTVRDSGVGFDEEFADKLFDPFTQAEQGPDRPGGGLGLGLAIASRLAKLQEPHSRQRARELIGERCSPLGFRSPIVRMSFEARTVPAV